MYYLFLQKRIISVIEKSGLDCQHINSLSCQGWSAGASGPPPITKHADSAQISLSGHADRDGSGPAPASHPPASAPTSQPNRPHLLCKAERRYLLTLRVSRYRLSALNDSTCVNCKWSTSDHLSRQRLNVLGAGLHGY